MNRNDKLLLAELVVEVVAIVLFIIEMFKDIVIVFQSPKEELIPAIIALVVSIIPIMALIVMINPNRILVGRSIRSSNQVRGKFIRTENIKIKDNKEIEVGVYKYTLAGVNGEARFIWARNSYEFPDKLDLYIDGKLVRTSNTLLIAESDRKTIMIIQMVLMIAISVTVLGCLIFGFYNIV